MATSRTQPRGRASLATRVRVRGRQEVLRAFRNPFVSQSDRPLLVHCSHHKSGTLWFQQVLLAIVRPYGLHYQWCNDNGRRGSVEPRTDVIVFGNAGTSFQRQRVGQRSFRGSHVIRDPRDVVVSGYEYHKRTHEWWVHRPNPRYGGRSYQEHLNSLNEHDGLMAEIDWVAHFTAAGMGRWDYEQPEFVEIRYEDALADQQGTFERLFHWYGLNDSAISVGMEAVERLSAANGGAVPNHVRSGQPGEWRDRLSDDHVQYFKELTGDLVVRLGYESTSGWSRA
ncbi:MAG: sulfotransferase domain-containing protein [Acidimicrobiales bacterium]